jgi:hypothetical protein
MTDLASSHIRREDVLSTLDGKDPHHTNAKAIREILGRGSYKTIQKHLDQIRREYRQAAGVENSSNEIPEMPDEMTGVWRSAYISASNLVLRRMEQLASDRDASVLQANTIRADVESSQAELDELTSRLDAANLNIETLYRKEQSLKDSWTREVVELQLQCQTDLSALKTELAEVKHTQELERRDRSTERLTLQTTIDRQVQQIVELRTLLSTLRATEQEAPPI